MLITKFVEVPTHLAKHQEKRNYLQTVWNMTNSTICLDLSMSYGYAELVWGMHLTEKEYVATESALGQRAY